MFKKVIGQDSSASQGSNEEAASQSHSAPRSESRSSVPAETSPSQPSAKGTRNVLSSDVEIKGTVKFEHDLIVDGKIEGEIHSAGNLTVGENARLKAEIKTGTVVVYGKIHGNIEASDRVDLKSGAEVLGDIKAKILVMESGAIFVGKSTVGTPTERQSGSATPSSSSQAQAQAKRSDASQPSLPQQGSASQAAK